MINTVGKRFHKIFWLLSIIIMLTCGQSYAAAFNLTYEQAVTDSWGNEIGHKTVSLTSLDQLPYGSPWRDYLEEKLPDGTTIYNYLKNTSRFLVQPLNLIISDRNSTCNSSKSSDGYNLRLYKYVTNFATPENKVFIAMHEFGHIAMLNGYPSNYDFTGLDYGSDNKHYMDEILPNHNTAWVEGWANAFAALKNNGKVFHLDMNYDYVVAFLQDNTFDEMARNELFTAKMLYDTCNQLPDGKTKAFNAISKTGPHRSLSEFCNAFTKTYPNDKVALAKLLMKNSQGKISLNEMLSYVNAGSRTVTRDLYNYLATTSLLQGTTTAGNASNSNTQTTSTTSNTGNSTVATKPATSFWGRIFGWFSNLFGSKDKSSTQAASAPQNTVAPTLDNGNTSIAPTFQDDSILATVAADAPIAPSADSILVSVDPNTSIAPTMPSNAASAPASDISTTGLAQAQEDYYRAFAAYNKLISENTSDKNKVQSALKDLKTSKTRLKALRKLFREGTEVSTNDSLY